MIIALGFKVDNERAIQFRKWANEIVKEYTIKGFAMDDERQYLEYKENVPKVMEKILKDYLYKFI